MEFCVASLLGILRIDHLNRVELHVSMRSGQCTDLRCCSCSQIQVQGQIGMRATATCTAPGLSTHRKHGLRETDSTDQVDTTPAPKLRQQLRHDRGTQTTPWVSPKQATNRHPLRHISSPTRPRAPQPSTPCAECGVSAWDRKLAMSVRRDSFFSPHKRGNALNRSKPPGLTQTCRAGVKWLQSCPRSLGWSGGSRSLLSLSNQPSA